MSAIDAIYRGGKCQPLGRVNLAENQHVRLTFEPSPAVPMPDEAESYRRLESVQTLAELMALRQWLPTDKGDYDLERWIQESRKLAGETI